MKLKRGIISSHLDFNVKLVGWKQVDANGKGKLDYGEFVAVSLHLQRMANDEHLRKAFSYFDKDRNGYIEPDELREALMEDGADDCTDVANDIFQEVDTDKVRYFALNTSSFSASQIDWQNCFVTAGWTY